MLRTRSPLVALLATASVVTAALVWFGWRVAVNQQVVEQQRVRDRVEVAADAIEARLRGRLAETGEQLSAWLSNPLAHPAALEGFSVVGVRAGRVIVSPAGLPHLPFDPPRRPNPLPDSLERLEFTPGQSAKAVASYSQLSNSADREVAATALARYARIKLRSGRFHDSRAAYRRLASHDGDVEGYPASLLALDGEWLVAIASGDQKSAEAVASEMARHLDAGRWQLPRATAENLRDRAPQIPRSAAWLIAEGMAAAWAKFSAHMPDRGLDVAAIGDQKVICVWRARSGAGDAAIAAIPASRWFVEPSLTGVAYQLTDANGVALAGSAAAPRQSVARVIADAQVPWTLRVWSAASPSPALTGSSAAMLVAAVLMFLWGAVYFIVRALRREVEVARLQSDFVAAVSHEFRSPLTSVRQLAEMLEMGQVPSDERRQQYFGVMAAEARRLQRLVETLLDFGRLEEHDAPHETQALDIGDLVRATALDVERSHAVTGRRVEVSGPEPAPRVSGDRDTLSLALRNLIDNALKYSPGESLVSVQWAPADGQVAIRVIDRGLGIDASERAAIFRKFVRGRAAREANVKGTGVGLAMVQRVVMAHGGRIEVDSEPGTGSTFTMVLPEAR